MSKWRPGCATICDVGLLLLSLAESKNVTTWIESMLIPKQLIFEQSEYEGRIAQLKQKMHLAKLDAVLLFNCASVYYLSGMDSENQFDYQCLVVPAKADPTLVILDFELGRYENSSWIGGVEVYEAFDDPIETTLSVARRFAGAGGKIGIEMQSREITSEICERLISGLFPTTVVDSFGLVESCRIVKSAAEIAYMESAARLTDIGVEAGYVAIRAGTVDNDVAAAIVSAMYRNGSNSVCWGPIVAAGYRAGTAHSTFDGYRLKTGDAVFLEITGQTHRYVSPLMRTAFLGEPSDAIRRVEEAVMAAISTILKEAREGTRAADVARAAVARLEPVLEGMIFHHNFGYPVGIGYAPSWIERFGFFLKVDNHLPLKAGMTFHLPMSLRKYGEYAVNLSQTILIREDGAVPLGNSPAALQIIAS